MKKIILIISSFLLITLMLVILILRREPAKETIEISAPVIAPAITISPDEMEAVDNYAKEIDSHLDSYTVCEGKVFGLSAEGASLLSHYDPDDNLVRLDIVFYGETGRLTRNIYMENDTPVFIHDLDIDYDKPFYIEGWQEKPAIDSRYYLKNQKLAFWLKDGSIISSESEDYADRDERLQKTFVQLNLEKLKKKGECGTEEDV